MNAAAPTRRAPRFDARWLAEVLALAALYFLTARLGLLLAIPGGHVTPVWPPSGIALAAVLLRGRRVWPGIWLGSFAANFWDFHGSPMSLATELGTSAVFGVGASLAALLGTHLLRRFVGDRNPLERVRDVCAFMALGGVVSCLASATLGVTTLCLAGYAPWAGYGQTWLTWWLGDTAGVFVVAPMLLVWGGTRWMKPAARWVELSGCFGLLIAATYYVFIANTTILFTVKPLTFVLIPFLVWPALRFGRRGAVAAAGLIALLAVWGTIHGTGPFSVAPRNEALLLLELFLSVVVLTALCMAAMLTEREHAEAAQQRAVEELESRVQERTAALTQSEAQARQHLAEAERARASLLSILEDQRAAEAALQMMRFSVDHAGDGVIWVSPGGRMLYANESVCTGLGYSASELLDLNIFDLDPDYQPGVWAPHWEELKRRGTMTFETRHRTKAGRVFPIEVNANYVCAGGKEFNFAFIRDITGRKQAETERQHATEVLKHTAREIALAKTALEAERAQLADRVAERTLELRAANVELEHANRLKSEFLANMSHELRTPLNAILGLSEAMLEQVGGPLTPRQVRSATTIHTSGEHLLTLINDILDLSKIEAGKLDLHLERVNVEDLCQASLGFVKTQAMKKRIGVACENDGRVAHLQADPKRLKQILVNLLTNAVKFTAEGGNLGLTVSAPPGEDTVRFTVWDTGIGIAAEDAPRLFRAFTQIDSGLNRAQAGTGLGLALVAKLADLHGGSVALESEPGRGSRFTVTLPLPPDPDAGGAAGGSAALLRHRSGLPSHATGTGGPLILLAEDNEANIETMGGYLEGIGHRMRYASNGLVAVKLARELRPALILMDIQMPVMDGLTAIREIRADPALKDIPIVALTGLAMPGDRERCLAAGANDYLSKPVKLGDLVQRIRQHLKMPDPA